MKISKHIPQTCLIIVENLNTEHGDNFEIGACQNYSNSMMYELDRKLPELDVHIVSSYGHAMDVFKEYQYAIVSALGNYIEWYNISIMLDRLIDENLALIAHVLHKDYYEVHEQCFVLDVTKWKTAGSPNIRSSAITHVYSADRSIENIHDDYTPVSLQSSLHQSTSEPFKIPITKFLPGSFLLSELLKMNYKISNFTEFERKHKYYLYGGTEWFYQALLSREHNAYCKEPLKEIIEQIPNDIEQYFGIASPYFIIAMALKNPKCKNWAIVDVNHKQLLYCKFVLENLQKYEGNILETFEKFLEAYPWIKEDDFESIETNLFLSDLVDYIQNLVKDSKIDLGNVTYKLQNLWIDNNIEIKKLGTLAYTSNVFRYPPQSKIFSLARQKQAEEKFLATLRDNNYIVAIVNDMEVELL